MKRYMTVVKAPVITPIELGWSSKDEKFITLFTHHAVERMQDYKFDISTMNVPLMLIAEQVIDLKNKTTFALVDNDTQTTMICRIEVYDDLTICIAVITVLNHIPYHTKKKDFALQNVKRIFMIGDVTRG